MPSRRFLLPLLLLLILPGCRASEPEARESVSQVQPLRIGLIPEQNIFRQVDRYQPLLNYVAEQLGVTIEVDILRHYGSVVRDFANGNIDGAFLGSFSYVIAHHRLGIEALARPESPDGTSTYRGLIFARIDSGITTPESMKGKVFAFVDGATSAGYVFPLAYCKTHGIADYGTFFSETYFAGTHDAAIYDVLTGHADMGAAKDTVYQRLAESDPRITRDLSVLDRSPAFPENALAVRSDLAPDVKRRLKGILLRMHEDPRGRAILAEFGARLFIETTDADFAPLMAYVRSIGLDLARYDDRGEPATQGAPASHRPDDRATQQQ
jgi:phosphonate transport system substrate-binding protein